MPSGSQYRLNPDSDLRPVCPNCHAMLHQTSPPYSIEDLRDIISTVRGSQVIAQ